MIVSIAGAGSAGTLLFLSAMHVYWAFGGPTGAATAIPTINDTPMISPSKSVTLVVAFLLAVASLLVSGCILKWSPSWLFHVGATGAGVVVLVRAIGEGRYVGLFKRVRDTPFGRQDTLFYSPLCLLISVASLAVAIS